MLDISGTDWHVTGGADGSLCFCTVTQYSLSRGELYWLNSCPQTRWGPIATCVRAATGWLLETQHRSTGCAAGWGVAYSVSHSVGPICHLKQCLVVKCRLKPHYHLQMLANKQKKKHLPKWSLSFQNFILHLSTEILSSISKKKTKFKVSSCRRWRGY